MAATSKIAYLLERLAQGVAAHDRENPGHHTWGIGMAHFDIERLGLEEGEEILSRDRSPGRWRCHRARFESSATATMTSTEEAEEEYVDAVAEQDRELEIAKPAVDAPPPLRPPV